MSLQTLLLATRDVLKATMGLTAAQCDVMPGPEPPDGAGQLYVAVHPGGGWSNSANESLDERFGFCVTVSQRVADSPRDRTGPHRLAAASTGVLAQCEIVRAVLHSSYPVLNAANTAIGGDQNGFVEPPRFRDAGNGKPREVGADWFGGAPGSDKTAGLTLTLTFRDARRVQAIENLVGQASGGGGGAYFGRYFG